MRKHRHAIFSALTLAFLSALVLTAVRSVQAQTETVLYNFTNGSDGGSPGSRLTSDGKGNFYGTTYKGGLGFGTVFELSPDGIGGWNESVLYSFTGAADGGNPFDSYVTFDSAGNLYGTAYYGGADGHGVVFELSPQGASWSETVLYSFTSGSNSNPVDGLIFDPKGNIYGTTHQTGGTAGYVFELSLAGHNWTEQVIYTAASGSYAGLAMDVSGNIFGTTSSTVFELSPNGGGWNSAVLHTFDGGKDGSNPDGTPVLDQAGNLYGTTDDGCETSCGTLYKLTLGKKGWTEKILHHFTGHKKDGVNPETIVFDTAGNIYGSTVEGGKAGVGTVFELVAPVGKGAYEERVLWSFNETDGSEPGPVILVGGNLYGAAALGGSTGGGVVYEVTP
jgi:uncharacterized repeat protein (TIGR03803 family)